jgi:hypothetical protein
LFVDQLVSVAVAADLVAALANLPHQLWKSFGYPSEDEKRCLAVPVTKDIEQPAGILFDARLVAIPFRYADRARKRRDLEVIFDVDS